MDNVIRISGVVDSDPSYGCYNGVHGYRTTLNVQRYTDVFDIVPVHIPDAIKCNLMVGDACFIKGILVTENTPDKRLDLYVVACEVIPLPQPTNENFVLLQGNLCKKHKTCKSSSMHVTTSILAVKNGNITCGFVPFCSFGIYSNIIENTPLSTALTIHGGFRSRNYIKGDEVKTTYEIGVDSLLTGIQTIY